VFLNGTNYQKVVGFIRQYYTSKLGSTLPERMDSRIGTIVKHYMTEVARVQGDRPVNSLNQEVVNVATKDMYSWLAKQNNQAVAPPKTNTVGAFSRGSGGTTDEYKRLFENTTNRYDEMLAQRNPLPSVPATPEFSLPMDTPDSNVDPSILLERLAKQREEQARALGIMVTAPAAAAPAVKLEIREVAAAPSAAAPTPPQAEPAPAPLAPRPQEYIIPQESVQKYRETEYNIFLTSSDRDWLRNTNENRYNFTVNFNTSLKKSGYSFSPALQNRFRNIQRIEFVKAIVPLESFAPLVRVASLDGTPNPIYDITRVVNVFSLPFVGVRITELENNGFSTNPNEDSTFAIIQYDTTWSSDLVAPNVNGTTSVAPLTKSGYTGMIPKFLKTQKVYAPTPLATLQRLSIRMENHGGDVINTDSDVLQIRRAVFSSAFLSVGTIDSANKFLYGDIGTAALNSYVFLQTSAYFAYSAVSEGDNIQINAYSLPVGYAAANEFTAWLNDTHNVVAVGYVDSLGKLYNGRNNAGYCNVIVLRNRFADPTTGSVARNPFGGDETTLTTDLDNTTTVPSGNSGALINLSRQTHFVLRVITRDYDSNSNIRPDNI
jgi:hypothetical protein